jgi:hypothetical protein
MCLLIRESNGFDKLKKDKRQAWKFMFKEIARIANVESNCEKC